MSRLIKSSRGPPTKRQPAEVFDQTEEQPKTGRIETFMIFGATSTMSSVIMSCDGHDWLFLVKVSNSKPGKEYGSSSRTALHSDRSDRVSLKPDMN